MRRKFAKKFLGILLSLVLLHAGPALALGGDDEPNDSVPVLLDASVLRPAGLITVVGSFLEFVILAPVVAITRPTDFGTFWHSTMDDPVRFTFVDPLGSHPDPE